MAAIPTGQFPTSVIPYPVPATGFVTQPHPNNTWTWAQRLGKLLYDAEAQFGPRDMSWTILGIEFGGAVPMVWYPQCYPRSVAVRSSEALVNSPAGAFSELAHEVVHLLSPTGGSGANNFEEGVATVFSEDQCMLLAIPPAIALPSYQAAANAVRRLLALDPNGVSTIRTTLPNFGSWTAANIAAHFPGAARADLDFLCERFIR